jgi:hypothetical protein
MSAIGLLNYLLESRSIGDSCLICMLLKCEGANTVYDLRLFIAVLVSKGIPSETVIVLANIY